MISKALPCPLAGRVQRKCHVFDNVMYLHTPHLPTHDVHTHGNRTAKQASEASESASALTRSSLHSHK